jgi:hypothetical protein
MLVRMKLARDSSTNGKLLALATLVSLCSFDCSSSGGGSPHDARPSDAADAAGGKGGKGGSGATGAAGATGGAGATGTAGADAAAGGAAGVDAATGTAGADAAAGAAGADAAAGADGASNADGSAGGDGATDAADAPTDHADGVAATDATDAATDRADGADGAIASSALELAELALTDGSDPNLLTATHLEDADGNQTPIGWGPKTLPSPQQRDAATALIRKIASLLPGSARNVANTGPYTATDVNLLNGLLALNANPIDLFSGTSLAPRAGTALDAFEAGVVADTFAPAGPFYLHGLAAGSSDATFGAYISGNGTDPEGVVGLVNNIVKLALQHGFETQLHAF